MIQKNVGLPFAPTTEKFVKSFISWRYLQIIKINTLWNTQKIKALFNNKYKVSHYICKI